MLVRTAPSVIDVDALLPGAPEWVSPQWVTDAFGLADKNSVMHAIRTGKLPAERQRHGRRLLWAIRPADALLIWGHRLRRAETTNA